MKVFTYILSIIFFSSLISYDDLKTGIYSGEDKNKFQELKLNPDSTFTYKWRDKIASLAAGTTQGRWYIKENKLILKSEYQLDDFIIEEKWIDTISGTLIQIENFSGKPIWELNSVILNNDTTEVKNFSVTDVNSDNALDSCTAKFQQSFINNVTILEGSFPIFKYQTMIKKVNYLKIKGNFANDPWYAYFNKVEFKIGKNKLIGPNQFGKFKLVENQ